MKDTCNIFDTFTLYIYQHNGLSVVWHVFGYFIRFKMQFKSIHYFWILEYFFSIEKKYNLPSPTNREEDTGKKKLPQYLQQTIIMMIENKITKQNVLTSFGKQKWQKWKKKNQQPISPLITHFCTVHLELLDIISFI